MLESLSGMGILWILFLILTFFVPFFIFKIRNEVVKMNKKMDTIIDFLGNSMTDGQKTAKQALRDIPMPPLH